MLLDNLLLLHSQYRQSIYYLEGRDRASWSAYSLHTLRYLTALIYPNITVIIIIIMHQTIRSRRSLSQAIPEKCKCITIKQSALVFGIFLIRVEDKVYINKVNGIKCVYPVNRSTQRLMSSLQTTCSSGAMTILASVSLSRTSWHEAHD